MAPPMHLNIVNPNTSEAMTRTIAQAAARGAPPGPAHPGGGFSLRSAPQAAARGAPPGTTIRAVASAFGPASIEGAYDDAFAVPGLLARIAEGEAEGADAHVIACFDDTAL